MQPKQSGPFPTNFLYLFIFSDGPFEPSSPDCSRINNIPEPFFSTLFSFLSTPRNKSQFHFIKDFCCKNLIPTSDANQFHRMEPCLYMRLKWYFVKDLPNRNTHLPGKCIYLSCIYIDSSYCVYEIVHESKMLSSPSIWVMICFGLAKICRCRQSILKRMCWRPAPTIVFKKRANRQNR